MGDAQKRVNPGALMIAQDRFGRRTREKKWGGKLLPRYGVPTAFAGNCFCISAGQEPKCLGGHGWPREAGIPAIHGIAGNCSCISGIPAIHGHKKTGGVLPRRRSEAARRANRFTTPRREGAYMSYADSPCAVMSRPSRSCSSVTRSPNTTSASLNATSATTAVQTIVMPTALAWISSCSITPG